MRFFRKASWEADLHKWFHENKDTPFEWGKWDCALFADSCVQMMTGDSLIPESFKWSNEQEAIKVIKENGGSLRRIVHRLSQREGLAVVPPAFITAGDICILKLKVDGRMQQIAGISDGYKILSPSDTGFAFSNNSDAQIGYRLNG